MTCIPKHIACEWYNPEIDSGFVAGSPICNLQIINIETKSRLNVGYVGSPIDGGTFFRSKGGGTHTNDITISSTWQVLVCGGSPTEWIDYDDNIHIIENVGRVKLVISDGDYTETNYATQVIIGGSPCIGPPGVGSPQIWISAIPDLRSQLENSLLIRMPLVDNPTGWKATRTPLLPWSGSPPIPSPPDRDGSYLSEFTSTSLSGGGGGDSTTAGLFNIRTGPILSVVFIISSEVGNDIGTQVTVEIPKYWNGGCWRALNDPQTDCVVSPTDCQLDGGPLNDCDT